MKQPQNILNNFNKQKNILCFSIIVTGRCNANCSYCHFFATHDRKNIGYDITDALFDTYVLFISEAKKILPINIEIQCRFSGGEPLLLGDRIFDLATRVYSFTHIMPYILTNGEAIDKKFVNLAKKSYLNHLYVSIENPLDPDKGAPDPIKIMNKIKKYNSEDFPIIPGVTVIKNEHFKNLYKICRIFYEKVGYLPVFSEVSFNSFGSPTRKQLNDLYKNVFKVVRCFYPKTAIRLFPDISPELYCGGHGHYILQLDLENSYKLTKNNTKTKLRTVLNCLNRGYLELKCKNKNCEWYNDCRRVKWIWKEGFGKFTSDEKIKNYCNLKKTINNAFFDALELFK